MFKFLLILAVIYLVFVFVNRALFGTRRKTPNRSYGETRQTKKTPENQEERILEYQKKNFESSDAEDVDFEEIKHND